MGWRGGIGLARVVGSMERTGNKTEVRIGLGVPAPVARIVRAAPPSPTPFPVARLEKQIAWQLPRSIGFSLLLLLHPLCKRHHLIPIPLNVSSWRVCSTVPLFLQLQLFFPIPPASPNFPHHGRHVRILPSASPIQREIFAMLDGCNCLVAMLSLFQSSCATNT